jgi:hypothetical protein
MRRQAMPQRPLPLLLERAIADDLGTPFVVKEPEAPWSHRS